MVFSKDKLISFDFQGGGIYKMSLRDILEAIGFKKRLGYWFIKDTEELDIFPRILHDDGMGYGVDEEKVVSVDLQGKDGYCNIFADKEIENALLWYETDVYLGQTVKTKDGREYFLRNIRKNDKGEIEHQLAEYRIPDLTAEKPKLAKVKEIWVRREEFE